MIRYLGLLLFLNFASCGLAADTSSFKDSIGRQFLIMPPGSLEQARQLFQKEKSDYWAPSTTEAKRLVELLRAALTRGMESPAIVADLARYAPNDWRHEYVAQKIKEVLSRYSSYSCQVIGFKNEDRMIIAFSFYPTEMARSRKNVDADFIQVFDGGASFWRIEYDLKKKRFVRFTENGDA